MPPPPGVVALAQHAYPFMRVAQMQGQNITYSALTSSFYASFLGVCDLYWTPADTGGV